MNFQIQRYCKFLQENNICSDSKHQCSRINDPEGQKICEGITSQIKGDRPRVQKTISRPVTKFDFSKGEREADEEWQKFCRDNHIPIPKT